MALVLADVRERIETDVDDAVLQRILDANVQSVDRSAGSSSSQVETVLAASSRMLTLFRRHNSITTVEERRSLTGDLVTLASDDYREVGDYRLLRLSDGTNPATTWGAEVVVTYVPEIDEDLRDQVVLGLCELDVEFRAFEKEKVGDWSGDHKDWKKERRSLLSQIREGRSLVL